MRIFDGLKFMFRARGLRKGFRRLACIAKRFGISPEKQLKSINEIISIFSKHEITGNLFIPAKIVEFYFKYFSEVLDNKNIEWGIHCDVHTDMSRLTKEQQLDHINNAVKIFDKQKISFNGFRAPYLRVNKFTNISLQKSGRFIYNSSTPILWDDLYKKKNSSFQWARYFCNPMFRSQSSSLPSLQKGIVNIPVSLPDDDMLIDRDNFDSEKILAVWRSMLTKSYDNNEVLVIQLHPERIFCLSNVLDTLISEAKRMNPPIWITSLKEIAVWWRDRVPEERRWPAPYESAFCVSGDIDSITIFDFVTRLMAW